jgi:Integrase core domain
LAVPSRFLIDVRVGPRTLELAKELVTSVAWSGLPDDWPLLLVDDHLPYPRAVLEVFGQIRHRRRRTGRGRKKHPDLKPPVDLWLGVVKKIRSATGRLLAVQTRALFGRKKDLCQRIVDLAIGSAINTSHLERLNGTMRGHQARLLRRTQSVSRVEDHLQWSLWLWRDFYNWIHPHGSLEARTPALAQGLSDHEWSVAEYVSYPVHVGTWQRLIWAEEREKLLTSPLFDEKP